MVVRTVIGQYLNSDGVTPVRGYLEFTPSSTLVDNASSAVIPVSVVRAVLDTTGSFSVDLQVTDEVGFEPIGWLWSVEEKIPGGQQWYLAVPTGGTPLDIVDVYDPDLAPAPILPGTHTHTYALDDLSDVNLTGAVIGQVLTKTGANTWGPVTPAVGGSSGNLAPGIPLEDFAGATDDIKLATAMTAIAAMSTKAAILLQAGKQYTFAAACPDPYDGFALIGGAGAGSNPEQGSKNTSLTKVSITYNGTWLNPSTTKWNIKIMNIDFTGTSNTTFCNSATQTAWCWHFRNVGFNSFKTVIGTQAAKFLMTACTFDGWWDIANSYDGAIHIGGSDNKLWHNGMLIDSSPAYAGGGQYHMWLDGLQKSTIGPIYMTVQETWAGILVSGSAWNTVSSDTNGMLMFLPGGILEGKNSSGTEGCQGALFRQKGGIVTMSQWCINYGMYSPSSLGHTPVDAGIIHVSDGGFFIGDKISYARCTNVAETVPLLYVNGSPSKADMRSIIPIYRGGTWTAKPRYEVAVSGVVTADDTMQSSTGVVGTRFTDWTGTQAQYDALSPKDPATSYYIVG